MPQRDVRDPLHGHRGFRNKGTTSAGVRRAFRLPKNPTTTTRLITAANAMASAAEQFRDTFISRGLPSDFVDQLRAATQQLTDATTAVTESWRQRDGRGEGPAEAGPQSGALAECDSRVASGSRSRAARGMAQREAGAPGLTGSCGGG